MINILKQLLFVAIISICASLTAFAQKDGDKDKTPPKPPPPVVVVKPKPTPPKDDKGDKPKKPQAAVDGALQLVKIIFD